VCSRILRQCQVRVGDTIACSLVPAREIREVIAWSSVQAKEIRETIAWSSVPARELKKPSHEPRPGLGDKSYMQKDIIINK